MTDTLASDAALGSYLKDRRARLDPASFGLPRGRRRTPGLRREEVAQRACISATWYTWLEQGRGGAPSAPVLDRIARALMLTDAEREHVFLLGLGRPPAAQYRSDGGVTPRLQRVLDAFGTSPAFVKTATWDVVAWNAAMAVTFTDYAELPPEELNVLRMVFGGARGRTAPQDWETVARYLVGAFRADVARAGATAEVDGLVRELSATSPEFAAMWRETQVNHHGEGLKRIVHPVLGALALEYSTFTVDGRPDLAMLVYNPVDPADAARIGALIARRAA